MCEIDFDETCPVWQETEHRSAKDRKCNCCDQTITKGERYLKHRSLFDGHWWSESVCLPCHEMRKKFAAAEGHMLTTPSSFSEYLTQCVELHDREDPWMPLLNAFRIRCNVEPYVWEPDDETKPIERYEGHWT